MAKSKFSKLLEMGGNDGDHGFEVRMDPGPPSHADHMRDMAKGEMRDATRKWIRGEMSTREHSRVHSKARHVLRNPTRAAVGMKRPRGRG